MDIIYVSSLTEKEKFFDLFKNYDKLPGQQGQKYHRLTAEGIAKNGCKVHAVTSFPITTENYSGKYIPASKSICDNVEYNYLPVINFPLLKNIVIMISSFFKTLGLIRKNKNCKVICDILNVSVSIGARLAAKLSKTESVGIVTDVPVFLNNNKKSCLVKINTKIMNSFDSYVFLTEEMKNVVNSKGKKYIVIEGLVDIDAVQLDNALDNKYESKVCMYAGMIHKIYGVKYLTEAFLKADIPDAELHIYGKGDYRNELEEICKATEKVKYFAERPNEEVVLNQLKATLLINPRPTNEEYTKYSFPSKNMEYMVSGTPVLTTKLPGMPKEYYPYVYMIENESVDGLSKNLEDILTMPKEALHEKGSKAKEWVLENKNNVKQAKKIIEMLERK